MRVRIRHPGYRISTIKRKRIEEPFGWMKTVGGLRKLSYMGSFISPAWPTRRCTHDDGMAEQQLDLFAHRGGAIERGLSRSTHHALLATEIDDESLIAAIAELTFAEGCKLVAEAGRRRLAAAVPALAALCRSFTAFGTRRMIPEQTAAIEALAIIGGREAAHAVLEMIERAVVQGPGLQLAVSAAARLGSVLSQDALCQLLRHAEPRIRADACRCARPLPELILLLIDLLDDLDQGVATSAACALGRMGRIEARGRLKSLLRDDPSEDVIDGVVAQCFRGRKLHG